MLSALRFLSAEILTLSVAFASAAGVFEIMPKAVLSPPPSEIHLSPGMYISNPSDDPWRARAALECRLREGDLVLFGSSELTVQSEIAVQNFYPKVCGKPILAIGHAGFQSLPILFTLAGVRESLSSHSRIAVILS